MAKKIFVSYKYGDTSVFPLGEGARVRDYVDLLQASLEINDHINKGELDGEDLSQFKDETIASKLRAKIYDSSVSVIMISKNMRDIYKNEEDQWIPWEIAYSLREQAREGRVSATNAALAVVIPDESGNYDYFIEENTCQACNSKTIKTNTVFGILGRNMFNRKVPNKSSCANHFPGNEPHIGEDHSYIYTVKWEDFIANINGHLDIAVGINERINEYSITKTI